MRFIVLISLFLAWVLIASSNSQQTQEVGWTDDAGEVASRALEPSVLVSSGIVFLFFYLRFSEWPSNTPLYLVKRLPRFYTTRVRYQMSAFIYGMLMVGMFLIIYLFPDAFLGVLNTVSNVGEAVPSFTVGAEQGANKPLLSILSELAQHVSSQQSEWLYTAIVLVIVIWPKLPFSTDEAIRATLQRFAAIPTEARILINRLRYREDSFAADRKVVKRLVENSSLLEPDDFDPGNNPRRVGFLYAKLVYLTDRVAAETAERGFASTALQQPERYEDLERRAAELAVRLGDYRAGLITELREADAAKLDDFLQHDTLNPSTCPLQHLIDFTGTLIPDTDATGRYLEQQGKALILELEQLLDDIYYFIVTSILSGESSPRLRMLRFADLGIALPSGHLPFEEGDVLTYLLASLFAVIVVPTLAFLAGNEIVGFASLTTKCGELVPSDVGEAIGWSVIGMLQHGLAVVAAFVLMFAMDARRGKYDEMMLSNSPQQSFRRTASAISAFVNGSVVAFAVNVALFALLGMVATPPDAIDCRLDSTWIWTLAPGLTGGLTALYLSLAPRRRNAWTLAGLQSIATGLVTGMVAVSVIPEQVAPTPDVDRVEYVFLVYVVITAVLLGLAAGRIVLEVVAELSPNRALGQLLSREDVSAILLVNRRSIPVELRRLERATAMVEGELGLEDGATGLLLVPSVGELPVTVESTGDDVTRLSIRQVKGNEAVADDSGSADTPADAKPTPSNHAEDSK